MSGRPRPVTATVTKPKWMQIPNPDAMRKIRSRSLESNGSTASLTSLLDHDSYTSDADADVDKEKEISAATDSDADFQKKTTQQKMSTDNLRGRSTSARNVSPLKSRSRSSENNLSAWEQWVIEKAKEDRKKIQAEKQRKREEKERKERIEQEKRAKQQKAEVVLQEWKETKNKELLLQKKVEKKKKQLEEEEKRLKDERLKREVATQLIQWKEKKRREERTKKQEMKKKSQEIQQHNEKKKQQAELEFQKWLEKAKSRPKSAPNSYGYLSGKMRGYHDRSAYPQPYFYNPIPWQPPAVPQSEKSDKPDRAKSKSKPYKWNPEKYF